ncbi:MAG: lipid core-O-antigen ligase-like enyme [Solirubrobacterales bacterium]|nr:lipid core-O-antigen ligase-like enyme [Solirubrobacterales bacterium]
MKSIFILCAVLIAIAAVVLLGLRLVRATRLWPAALLIVTAPLEVYRSSSGAGLNVSVFRLALAVGVAALAVDVLRGRKNFTGVVAVPFVIYAGLLAWQLISLLFVTANHSLAYRFLGQYAAGLAAAFVITCYVERRDLRVLAGLCGAAAVLPLIAGAFRVFSVSGGGSGDLPGLSELPLNLAIEAARQGGSSLLNGTQRLNATFADPNQFGFYIATAFLVLLGAVCSALFFEKRIAWRTATSYILFAVSAGVAIVGTYSRSAWVLAAVGVAVLAALLGRSFWTRQRTIAACIVGVIALGLASPLVVSRLGSSEPGNVKSTQVHTHTMSIAFKLVAHHPLTGVGLGGYGRYDNQPLLISSAVSTFLTVTAELGIPGLMLLVAAVVVTSVAAIRSVLRSPVADRALLAGFVAAFIGLVVGNIVGEVWMNDFQWVLFGSLIAVTSQPRLALRSVWLRIRRAIDSRSPPTPSEQTQVAA